jgi:hypothetical protein
MILLGSEQTLRDRQRADLVVSHDAARVTDDVRVALLEPEQAVRVESRVHAGEHGDPFRRRERQVALIERGRVLVGVLQELVGNGHDYLLRTGDGVYDEG